MEQGIEPLYSNPKEQTMKGVLLRWLARYDGWCQEWGLTPENRRCCMPVRYDDDETEKAAPECDAESLNQNCESRRQ